MHIPTTTAKIPTNAVILCQPIAPVEGSVKIKATEVATNPTSISNMPIQVKISLIVSSLFFIFSFVLIIYLLFIRYGGGTRTLTRAYAYAHAAHALRTQHTCNHARCKSNHVRAQYVPVVCAVLYTTIVFDYRIFQNNAQKDFHAYALNLFSLLFLKTLHLEVFFSAKLFLCPSFAILAFHSHPAQI